MNSFRFTILIETKMASYRFVVWEDRNNGVQKASALHNLSAVQFHRKILDKALSKNSAIFVVSSVVFFSNFC